MIDMDAALLKLMRAGRITEEAAYEKCIDKAEFKKHLSIEVEDEM